MRLLARAAKCRPLAHAKLVLLVDHHQSQPGELHFRFDQGLRAQEQLQAAVGRAGQDVRPLARRRAAGEDGHLNLAGAEQFFQRAGVLPHQQLSRSHDRGLMPLGHGQQHRVHGHHGLAAADVSLQEPIHRLAPRHVGRNFGDHLVLAGRQLERKQAADPGVDLGRCRQRRSLGLGHQPGPPQGQGQLHQQQLLIDQPPLGPGQLLGVIGKVDLLEAPCRSAATRTARGIRSGTLLPTVRRRLRAPL